MNELITKVFVEQPLASPGSANNAVWTSGNQESAGVDGHWRDGNVDKKPHVLVRHHLESRLWL